MSKRTKRSLLLITFAVCLFVALNNIGFVFSFLKGIFYLCLPVVLGLIIAFVLNVPMRGFENLIDKITAGFKKRPSVKLKCSLSLFLTIISILCVIVLVVTIAIPHVTKSVTSLIETVDRKIPEFLIFLEKNGIDTTSITNTLSNFDLSDVLKHVTQGAFTIVSTAFDATVIVFKYFSAIIFSVIIAFYLLLDKYNLSRQTKKLCYSFLSKERADNIYKTAHLARDTFAKFLSGQCLEAVILAVILIVMFTIFKLPFASLIALLAAVLSFIPYIGSFIACAVGVLLTFIESPQKALICVIVYLAAQFIEQQFIYPHVVGSSVGLSPFFTIVAVLLGGNLFGVFGMIFFIPLFSVIFTLLREHVNNKNKQETVTETVIVDPQAENADINKE